MYKKVELKQDGFVGIEKEVRDLWDKENIVQKNFDKNKGKNILLFMMDHLQQMESLM